MGTGLTTSELHRLDRACIDLALAFHHPPYLVGSALTEDTFRDVDVRTILADDEFDVLFATRPDLWGMFCLAVSVYLSDTTGLRVDFQVQRQTEANEKHTGMRNPLALIVTRDAHGRGIENYFPIHHEGVAMMAVFQFHPDQPGAVGGLVHEVGGGVPAIEIADEADARGLGGVTYKIAVAHGQRTILALN